MKMIKVSIPGQTGTDDERHVVQYFDDGDTSTMGISFYNPQPVEIKIKVPKKPKPWHLMEAKRKEQLKVWGLRK